MGNAAPRTFSLLTPPGRGAVAVVQVTGDNAAETVDRFLRTRSGKPFASLPIGRVAFGIWQAPGESTGEELIAVRRSNRIVEVQCHGGDAAVDLIQRCLIEAGFERKVWTTGVLNAADEQIPHALTLRTASILLDQRAGALAHEFEKIVACVDRQDIAGARTLAEDVLARAPIGAHLVEYWRVVIAGEPNVGKSCLMNALVGYRRAIVHESPGTTRDALTARTAIDGWAIEFIDTAGLRETFDPIEAAGIDKARDEMSQADLVLLVRDASRGALQSEASLPLCGQPILLVWNKIDLVDRHWTPPASPDMNAVAVSAATGQGIDDLLNRIVARLVPHPPEPGAGIPITPGEVDRLKRVAAALGAGEIDRAKLNLK